MRVLATVLGLLGTIAIVGSIVDSMLIARSKKSRLTSFIGLCVLLVAKAPLRLLPSYGWRDRWLSGVAPVAMLLQLAIYGVLLILTLGLWIFGVTDLSFGDALYQSGSTFTTLGIVEPVNIPSTIITFVAAFLGLVVIAIFIGYLLALLGMYSDRESMISRLSADAGDPAWGPQVLLRGAALGRSLGETIQSADWINWMAQVRTNTLTNPGLAMFRSSSPSRHWVIAIQAMLDATSLKMAIAPKSATPDDVQLLSSGIVTLGILNRRTVHNWFTEDAVLKILSGQDDETRSLTESLLADDEWKIGWDALCQMGIARASQERAVKPMFLKLRGLYASDAQTLARKLHAIRAPWSGTRAFTEPSVFPETPLTRSGGSLT
jgi:hypothetical protein